MNPLSPHIEEAEKERLLGLGATHPGIRRVVALKEAHAAPYLCRATGLSGSADSVVLALLGGTVPVIAVAEDEEHAGYLYSDMAQIIGTNNLLFFPSAYRRHIKYGHTDEANEVMRTELLARLASGAKPHIVTYGAALAERLPEKDSFERQLFKVTKGAQLDTEQLRAWLVAEEFNIVDYVYSPGEAAFRGSIIDIFGYGGEEPIRIDLFGNEVESIRRFAVRDQLSLGSVEEVVIAARSNRTEAVGNSLLERLSEDYLLYFRDRELSLGQIRQLKAEKAVVVEGEGFASDAEMQRLLLPSEAVAEQAEHLWQMAAPGAEKNAEIVAFHTKPQPPFRKDFELFTEALMRYREEQKMVFFLTENASQAERLKEIVTDLGGAELVPRILPLTLHEGFEDEDAKMVFITDHQLFERYHKYNIRAEKIRGNKVALTLEELQRFAPGDYIVHYDHGIGQFAGLFKTKIGDVEQEVIKILYRNNDYIYVNLHSLHKLSKYRGKEDVPPELSELGGGAWQRLKERTKKKVKDIARDLIKLYAARKEAEGFAFSLDSYLQHELEASFIYEETPDQAKAVEAVKTDMESRQPMDRLICGDVGFGKTEVAMRAAFKAVADSKQGAVLVPTTLLAYQHYRTFTERFKGFPVTIAYYSRAKGTKESKAILEGLKSGRVDIVIGTHRLTGKEVEFKDLGLLIIDEEQKFGVAVKEKLRKMQVNVDTLTMSATPIPRTLQFSLMGTRDLSNIMTPPRNRYPIATARISFSIEQIGEAINYELSRNGQVYFVHNRIGDIEALADKLRKEVPDARIAVGHGRMNQAELEELILSFSRYEYDVLVATTIIENGIDVPNANTIFIDDAERYGLSDLHQLRGRVGRSNKKAFCYLITPPPEQLSSVARRRIKAIETYSDLGSGMRIALQDLDIRGAGNVFGSEQSGFIADLGFDAYHKLFNEAVREVKTEEFPEYFKDEVRQAAFDNEGETLFESDLALSLPPDYVPDDGERIELYRRLDGLNDEAEVAQFRDELRDRFGPLPDSALQLIDVPRVRSVARAMGFRRVVLREGKLRLFLPENASDAYYQSAEFDAVITYATIHAERCRLEESRRGSRLLRIEKVKSVPEALTILRALSATKPTLPKQ